MQSYLPGGAIVHACVIHGYLGLTSLHQQRLHDFLMVQLIYNSCAQIHRIHQVAPLCTVMWRISCNHFLSRRTAGRKGRAAGSQSHRCLERQVVHCAACSSWNLTRACCQRHATATKAYNWASAISWPSRWTAVSFVTSEKLVAWSVCV